MTKVYTLTGYPEEVMAHAFAKTSRSADSVQDMIASLTEEQSDNFHAKWVLKFGHSSIAEHVQLHLAVEDISRLAVEALESCRLASYTEQSTRYQTKLVDAVYINPTWDTAFAQDYKLVFDRLFAL